MVSAEHPATPLHPWSTHPKNLCNASLSRRKSTWTSDTPGIISPRDGASEGIKMDGTLSSQHVFSSFSSHWPKNSMSCEHIIITMAADQPRIPSLSVEDVSRSTTQHIQSYGQRLRAIHGQGRLPLVHTPLNGVDAKHPSRRGLQGFKGALDPQRAPAGHPHRYFFASLALHKTCRRSFQVRVLRGQFWSRKSFKNRARRKRPS